MSRFYFAWSGPADAWGPAMLVEDEQIFAIAIAQVEGDFPTLQIDVVNPRVGLLAAGRNLWCWLSYTPDLLAPPIPIFRGRLIGVPQNLQDEVVRLEFVAKPQDYQDQKVAVAATLQVAPYWDPVWLQASIADPDTALEARTQLWHIDRVSLAVTASDIIEGEDGTIDVTADDHFYDAMTITYGQTPLRRVNMTGTVTWDQTGEGTVDLTGELVAAFQAAGSPLPAPLVCSLTGDGLLNSWPAPGTSIGGGWSVGEDSSVQLADWIRPAFFKQVYADADLFPLPAALPAPAGIIAPGVPATLWAPPLAWEFPALAATAAQLPINFFVAPIKVFAVVFPLTPLSVYFTADWVAKRARSETVSFTLDADIQSILTDPGQAEEATITLSSAAISQAIDPGFATPLFDSRSPIYFPTPRGTQSVEYLLMLAAAKLLARARCVLIKFVTSWDFVIQWISCRYSVRLFDPRLPGGVAEGKITGYTLSFSTAGISAEVTIGCTIGHGGAVAAAAGAPSYSGNYANGWQAVVGAQVSPIPGQVVYLSLDNYLGAQATVTMTTTASTYGNTTLDTLAVTQGLVAGGVYPVIGFSIPAGTTFTYTGSGAGVLSQPAGATDTGVSVQFVVPPVDLMTGANTHSGSTVLDGLAATDGLVIGAVYDVTGPGISGGTTFTYTGSGAGVLSRKASLAGSGVPVEFITTQVIDDDALDLFNMTPGNVLQSTPAVSLTTTGNIAAGNPKLDTMGSDVGLLAGDTYSISGASIPPGASFVYGGSLAGTLSIAPIFTATGTPVTITGAAQNGFTITNGLADQVNVVSAAAAARLMPDPVAALKGAPTRVCLDLVSCDGGAFHSDYQLVVETMAVPKLIDLEAP